MFQCVHYSEFWLSHSPNKKYGQKQNKEYTNNHIVHAHKHSKTNERTNGEKGENVEINKQKQDTVAVTAATATAVMATDKCEWNE